MSVDNEHELKEIITLDVYYPDHPPRKESALFAKTKHHLVHVLDTPCFVCGSRENREVHHFHVEWAFSDAVDWDLMQTLHQNFDWSTFKSPEDFVDSEYNMMILCAKHHRLKDHGIHMLPYPVWIAQKLVKKEFILTPDQENGNKPAGN